MPRPAAPIAVLVLLAALIAATVATGAPAPDPARADFKALVDRGAAHEEAGRLDQAARDYAAALADAERRDDRESVATALVLSGYLKYLRGDMNPALEDLRRAYQLADALGDRAGRRAALGYIAHVYADDKVGEHDRAIDLYQQLLDEYRADDKPAGAADSLFNLASTLERKGDLEEALARYREALAAERALGRAGEAAWVERSIGMALGKLGRPAEALPHLERAVAAFAAEADADRAMMARQSRGIVLRALGRLPQALADLEASRDWFEANDNPRFLERSEQELAAAYAAAGRWPEAYAARSRHAELQGAAAEQQRDALAARLRVQFDLERAERENAELRRARADATRIRELQSWSLGLGALVLVVLTVFAVRVLHDRKRMKELALTDELTRLPNRRHLLAAAADAIERSQREGRPLALVAFDIDHFKRINDQHGHAAGDRVLRRVAHACRVALRPTDIIGRTGGEEFVAVLLGSREGDGVLAAERLRQAVDALEFPAIDPALDVTISLGVAEHGPGESLARTMARADARLYEAKGAGRNRVAPAPS